jgi:succinate dehydrogenase/fumarate reductase flavoprotein subunit
MNVLNLLLWHDICINNLTANLVICCSYSGEVLMSISAVYKKAFDLADQYDQQFNADVLIIGGGPAGCWAAIKAAGAGASVVLVDKGYCGTSGATAPSGTGVWYEPPNEELRKKARDSRDAMGGFLAEHDWMNRVLDRTYTSINQLSEWGYPFPVDETGKEQRRSLQGPEYMRLLRKQVERAGVNIVDHAPALELLIDKQGVVSGAAGALIQSGQTWKVRSGAVVIATGGCAFLSKALGTNVLTGDGYLLAVEAGAELSGMEFSNAYGLGPKHSSSTKSAFYSWANFYHEDGTLIEGAGSQRGRSIIARYIQENRPVFCKLDKVTEEMKAWMRSTQPNFFVSFDRLGIDPFTQLFEVTLRLEGTVRGTGGIRIVDKDCSTSAKGLYAAGDAATRELICGGFTGGGSHNAAWAISSGSWSGEAAARFAKRHGLNIFNRELRGLGGVGLRANASSSNVNVNVFVNAVQAEVFPFDKNLFRTEDGLIKARVQLDKVWSDIKLSQASNPAQVYKLREAAAMAATARWMYASALERRETRGMHKRLDYPEQDVKQHYRLITGGLDDVWVQSEQVGTSIAVAS